MNQIIFVFALAVTVQSVASIDGGELAERRLFPYLASFRSNSFDGIIHECGGAILNEKFILLAAHCIDKYKPVSYYVVAIGAHNKNDGKMHEIKNIHQHEYYVSSNVQNDIALVELVEPIEFSEEVQKIDLDHSFIDTDVICVIAGFDRSNDLGDLKYIDLMTMTNDECRKRVEFRKKPVHDPYTLCASQISSKGGLCKSDSGGPLVVNNKLIGIVSWSYEMGSIEYPIGFTRISEYIDWIEPILATV